MVEHLNFSGRIDRLYIHGDTALLIDWKSGFSEPDQAELNAQLKVLAVLVGINFPQIEKIYVQIISGPYGVSEAFYDLERLSQAFTDVIKTLRAISAEHATFSPGPEQCRFCSAINICQAVKDLVMPVAREYHDDLPDGEKAAKLLDEVEVLQNHLNEIRAFYHRKLQKGGKIPGYELVPGAPRRSVADWQTAREKLEQFIAPAKLDQLALFSIPAVEKLLGEEQKLRGPKLKARLAEILGPLMELNFPEPSMKRIEGSKPLIRSLNAN